MMNLSKRYDVGRLTRIALMGAIAVLLGFFPEIPVVSFYKLDFAYVPMLLTGYALGIVPGIIVLTLKNIFQVLTGSNSMMVGQLADMLMGAAMLLPAILIYHKKRTRVGALIGMASGTVCMIIVGVLANRYILMPAYLGGGLTSFMDKNPNFLIAVTAPFNLLKGASVSVITFVLYKHLARFLKNGLKG